MFVPDLSALDEDTLYELSAYLEPKEGTQPGPRPPALDDVFNHLPDSKLSFTPARIEKRRRQLLGSSKSRLVQSKVEFIDVETDDSLDEASHLPRVLAFIMTEDDSFFASI